jgi:cation-transporting P-type ATPase E
VLRFSVPTGLIIGAGAYAGYAASRQFDPAAGVAVARTTATFVVLIVAFWTLVVLARPLHPWKVALIATLVGTTVAVVAVPALGEGIVLLQVTPQALLTAAVIGAVGSVLVEISSRVFSATPAEPRTTSPPGR